MEAASSHRLAMSWKQQAAKPGATVPARRETIKAGLYDPLCSASATTFFPVAMETLGAIGPESLLFLREVGRRIEATTGDSRSTTFLLQRLSVAVQMGNALCVLDSLSQEQ